jgi:multidrug resistance efflux pump
MSGDWAGARWEPVPDSDTEPPNNGTTLAVIDPEPVDLDTENLTELASVANRYHAEAENAAGSALEAARQAGAALAKAKKLRPHGEWLPWLEANFHGSARTAQSYMRVASKYAEVCAFENADELEQQRTRSIDAALKALATSKPAEPKDPTLTMQSFLRRLATLGDDARTLSKAYSAITQDDADHIASAVDSLMGLLARRDPPSAAMQELYDRFAAAASKEGKRA